MSTGSQVTPLASELRIVLGRMLRRLRLPERAISPTQAGVLGRLEREGTQSIGALATAERVRPQSMSQTVVKTRPRVWWPAAPMRRTAVAR